MSRISSLAEEELVLDMDTETLAKILERIGRRIGEHNSKGEEGTDSVAGRGLF